MRIRNAAIAGLAGAAVAYFFDPVAGSARRRRLRERIATLLPGRAIGPVERPPTPENVAPVSVRPAASVTEAVVRPTEAESPPEDRTDAAIAGTVRQRLKERSDIQTGNLMIDVVQGVAYLRGTLPDQAKFDEIVDLTGAVPGVRRVQSLLHLPESETINKPTTRRLGDTWNG
jgi:hypothetical protein